MPLRTLLGYEPKETRRYDDYGGSFLSFTPARSVTANRKSKYKAPMSRVKKLPPIDEEATPVSTPRLRLNHESTQARIARLPKKAFGQSERIANFEPASLKPILSVKPIPREKIEPEEDLKYEYHKPERKESNYSFKTSNVHYHKRSPQDRVNHTLVDGVVADYLHYARYGNVIPIYEGTSSSACPCCTDRNKENVRTLLGLPKPAAKQPPQKYDMHSKLSDLKESEDLDEDARMFPNSMYSLEKKTSKREQRVTPAERQRQQAATQSQKTSWMNYQPLPFASNYLNPEFSRPSLTQDLIAVEAQRAHYKTANRIVEADSNFDTAMNKLETLNFGSGSYTDYH